MLFSYCFFFLPKLSAQNFLFICKSLKFITFLSCSFPFIKLLFLHKILFLHDVKASNMLFSYHIRFLLRNFFFSNLLHDICASKFNTFLLCLFFKETFSMSFTKVLVASLNTSTSIYYNNESAIQIAYNDVFHECTKHIELDCYFIRHHLRYDILYFQNMSSVNQSVYERTTYIEIDFHFIKLHRVSLQLIDMFLISQPPTHFHVVICKLMSSSSHIKSEGILIDILSY